METYQLVINWRTKINTENRICEARGNDLKDQSSVESS